MTVDSGNEVGGIVIVSAELEGSVLVMLMARVYVLVWPTK